MVKGIVAILDNETQDKVRELWAEFETIFNNNMNNMTHFPHFTFHATQDYAGDVLDSLESFVTLVQPLPVKTAGIGIFTGDMPVIHINVVRNAALTRLHKALWKIGETHTDSSLAYYAPDNWLPHITLAMGDFTSEQILHVLALLQSRNFNWESKIAGLGILSENQSVPAISYMLEPMS